MELFRNNISSAEVICSTHKEVIDYAVQESSISLIIMEEEAYSYSPPSLAEQLKDALGELPCVVFGDKNEISNFQETKIKGVSYLDSQSNIEIKKSAIKKLLESKKTKSDSISDEDLLAVSLKSFYYFDSVPYDAYYEVYGNKFMKMIQADEKIVSAKIQKLATRRVKELFVTKTAKLRHMKQTSEAIIRQIRSGGTNSQTLYANYISAAAVVQDTIKDFGALDFLNDLIDSLMHSMQLEIKSCPDIGIILAEAPFGLMDKSEQSILLLFLNLKMAYDLKWKTEASIQKLTLASLVHDVYIKSEELTRIRDRNDPIYTSLPNEKQQEFDAHITSASELEAQFLRYPSFSFLIEFHHVIPEKKYTNSLNSISCLFTVNRRFVTEVVNFGYNKIGINSSLKEIQVLNYGKFRESLNLLDGYFSGIRTLG